jgi:predicted nuclease with TOPRIM domain
MTNDKPVLDELKQLEERKRKIQLAKSLNKIKDMAKEILENKYMTDKIMEQLGVDSKEAKAIIDWINNLPGVKLDDEDKKKLDDEIKKDLKERFQEAEKEVEKHWFPAYPNVNTMNLSGTTTYPADILTITSDNTNGTYQICSDTVSGIRVL